MSQIDEFLTRWTDAERTADVGTLDTMLTDDFVGVGPLGFTLPKPAWLGRHQSGDLTYETYGLEEVDTRVHGDAALVTARQVAKGAFMGNPTPEQIRATLALVRDDGAADWQLAGIHMSFIAGTPGAPPLPGPPPGAGPGAAGPGGPGGPGGPDVGDRS
jgi:ketosteroid isomerase-like protein